MGAADAALQRVFVTYRVLADIVLFVHLAFIAFAVLGALVVVRWRWVVWLHLPAVVWAAIIEFAGAYCPLTPLENWFRARGGETGYTTGFIEHYLLPIIYPGSLTREFQLALGCLLLVLNVFLYALAYRRRQRQRVRGGETR